MNIKFITVCLLVLVQSQLLAHNPNQASIKLVIQEKGAFLDFNMSQYGIEQVLLKNNPDLDLRTISKKDLQQLIINEIKKQIQLTSNGKTFDLGTGVIKLGSHETNLKFLIEDLPEHIEFIDLKADCFHENQNQVNFFTILYKGKNARAKLFKENNYQSKFIITKDKIIVSDKVQNYNWNLSNILIIIISIICFLIIYFLVKKRKTVANNV